MYVHTYIHTYIYMKYTYGTFSFLTLHGFPPGCINRICSQKLHRGAPAKWVAPQGFRLGCAIPVGRSKRWAPPRWAPPSLCSANELGARTSTFMI